MPAVRDWSVVIPAYNEAMRLPAYLKEVVAYFDGRDQSYEVVVVDDGSRDATADCVRELARLHPSVRLHALPENRGKGCAVRTGMTVASGALRLMADADGATPIVEVKRLEAAMQAGADLAVGSRALPDPSVVVRARTHRKLSGQVWSRLVRALGVSGVVDTQCGFKLFRGPVADDLFRPLRTEGFGFDVELLLLARRRGYRIVEVPINWTDQPGSKVGVLKDGPRMLAQIVAARLRLALTPDPGSAP
ncbi:MAG: glycosyl transferase family 2 [Candidatus Rokubacteria bacterium GWC2_70_24]|nr:MAG: glycosyl transferase family 2 [Candidatus Rokubacteria bacterium GWC2_70_24]